LETVVMSNGSKRELIWLGVAVFAGLVMMPLLVYATGTLTLGPCSRGGAGRFLADFLRSLAGLQWQALVLAAAPITLVLAWRVIRAVRARRPGDEYVDARAARDASVRREPTL
jgi:hypothetical protein